MEENIQNSMPTDEESWLTDGEINYETFKFWNKIVPENILDKLTNEQLVRLLMEDGVVIGFTLGEKWEYRYMYLVTQSNVFDYTIQRPDIEKTFYEIYMTRTIEEEENADSLNLFNQNQFLEATLAQDVIYNALTEEERADVKSKVSKFCISRMNRNQNIQCNLTEGTYYSVFSLAR